MSSTPTSEDFTASNANAIVEAVGALRAGAKRRASEDPIQKWSPYYAGYSLEFAEAVLGAAGLGEGATVLDPWNGSGTTTLAASRLGLRGVGIDLNPFAVLVARARLVNPLDARGARGFAGEVAARETPFGRNANDPLRAWLSAAQVRDVRRILREILTALASPEQAPLAVGHDTFPPLAAFLILALVRTAKASARANLSSNPTIFRGARPQRARQSTIACSWRNAVYEMGEDLTLRSNFNGEGQIRLGDARRLDTPTQSVDFVLTSPPYCTRLDYGEMTRFELALVAPDRFASLPELRRSLMGAPLVRTPSPPDIPSHWPAAIRDVLERIRKHPSKASNSYYYKTYHQYFADADACLAGISNSLRNHRAAALVVQGSYYKEVKIDLPSLYAELAEKHDLRLQRLHRMPVRTVLSSIHPGTKKYRRQWDYDESIVMVRKEQQRDQ